MEKEIWKDIPGYNGYYQVSNLGKVKSLRKNLKAGLRKGYLYVPLKRKKFSIHRLVAKTFIQNPHNYPEVDHIDGNPFNNSVDNLRWVNRKQNELNPITRKRLSESLKGRKINWKIKKCRRLYMEKIDYDVVLGIDPGSNGGISVCYHDGNVKTIKMPKELSDIRQLLSYVKDVSVNPIVFVEKVQLRSDDISDNPGKAFRIQQLLMSFQRLKDYIEIENIPYVQVHPVTWQSYLKLRKKGEEKKDRKDRYKMAAGHYYPTVKPTLWNADAILIMHFGRLKIQNDPNWVFQNMTANSCQNSMF